MHDKPVALVTGASKAIGLHIAKDLAQGDYPILVGSRRLDAAIGGIRNVGADARAVKLDVTDQSSIIALVAHIHEKYGRLDVL